VRLIRTLIKNWWLLALCGVFDAIISVTYFYHAEHGFALKGTLVFLGRLTLAAGACTIAACVGRPTKGECWLLMLNGLALGALGLIFNGLFGFEINFTTVALLIILMAMSIGILELITARTLRRQRHVADGWFLGLAGVASLGFALAFFALGFGWIKLEPGPAQTLHWLGAYFSFSAVCMLLLGLRLGPLKSRQWDALPPLGNPKHVH
jgi:uncharacterized membrane protein HdeD (DUF308 family)